MWNDFIKNTLVRPLLERLGTVGATTLVVGGDWLCANVNACGLVTDDGARQVMTWVVAAALVCGDLAAAYVARQRKAR